MRIIVRNRLRVTLGLLAIAFACLVIGFGYWAPPQLACDEHFVFQAVGDFAYSGMSLPSGDTTTLTVSFTRPVYPFQHEITAVSVPDSALTVELLRVGRSLQSMKWRQSQSVWLRIKVPEHGRYVFTELDFHLANGTTLRRDIGRVILDARPSMTFPLYPAGHGGSLTYSAAGPTSRLAELAAANREKSPLTLLSVDAGEFGQSTLNRRLLPGETTLLDLVLTLPPETGRHRRIRIDPWLSIELNGKRGWTTTIPYDWQSTFPADLR